MHACREADSSYQSVSHGSGWQPSTDSGCRMRCIGKQVRALLDSAQSMQRYHNLMRQRTDLMPVISMQWPDFLFLLLQI